jgi:trimeric autotransporter adhesin
MRTHVSRPRPTVLRVVAALVLGVVGATAWIGATAIPARALGSPILVSVTVSPLTVNVPKGETEEFSATGHYSDDSTANLTDAVTWSTSSGSVATISNSSGTQGVATAIGTGAATITATDTGALLSGTATMTVVSPVLLTITVSPAVANVPVGETQQLAATGNYSDGTTQNLTNSATWSSSSKTTATVSQSGLVTAVGTGAATITAADSSVSGVAAMTVVSPVLLSVSVSPAAANVPSGETKQLTATGHYSDGTTANLTDEVTWSTSSGSTATVSSTGLVTADSTGAATITATDPSSSMSGTALITVLPAVLVAVTVSPSAANLPSGETQQLTATGDYSDGSTQNLTDDVTWSTSAGATASVSSVGLVTAGSTTGLATITATEPSTSIEGVSAITVLPAELLAITVTPGLTNVPKGQTQQLVATGDYSDGTTSNLTASVDWTTSSSTTATVSSTGLVTAVGTGAATITATDPTTSVAGVAAITVLPAQLTAIDVSPLATNLPAGETQQLTAMGIYSDGTQVNLTNEAIWSSSDATIASVSATGLVKADGDTGAATITAEDPSTGIQGTAAITDLPAELLAITVNPPAANLPSGETQQLTATGDYSDGSTADLTKQVTWSTSDSSIASVSSKGLVTAGSSTGPATITATDSSTSIEGVSAITVLPAVLLGITVDPPAANVASGETQQLTATGDYSDGSTQNLTKQVTWSTSDSSIASVSTKGLVTAGGTGLATITATDPSSSLSGVAAITVLPAELLAITVTPPAANLPSGETQQLTATGYYSDDSSADLSLEVTWSTSDSSIASVSSSGLVTAGSNTGLGTITATDPTTGIFGTAAITVLPAELVAVTVDPAIVNIASGETQQLSVSGLYSDGTTQNLSSDVTWSTSSSSIASVSPTGLLTAGNDGAATVTATDSSANLSGVSAITVLPGVLVSISVTPSPASVGRYGTLQLTATGHLSNLSTENLTKQVTWASDDAAVAPVSNTAGSVGLVKGAKLGSTTVTATDPSSGIFGSTQVTVTGPTIKVVPASVAYGSKFRVKGTGFKPGSKVFLVYKNGKKVDPNHQFTKVFVVGPNGTFTKKWTLPSKKTQSGPPGTHTIVAVQRVGQKKKKTLATATFTVTD